MLFSFYFEGWIILLIFLFIALSMHKIYPLEINYRFATYKPLWNTNKRFLELGGPISF